MLFEESGMFAALITPRELFEEAASTAVGRFSRLSGLSERRVDGDLGAAEVDEGPGCGGVKPEAAVREQANLAVHALESALVSPSAIAARMPSR